MKHLYYTLLGMVMLIAACSSPYQPPKPDEPTADMLTIDTTIYTFDTFFMQLNVREIPTQAGGGPYEHSFSVEGLPPNARGGFTKPQGTGSFDNTFYLMPYNTPEGMYKLKLITTSSDSKSPSIFQLNVTIKHCTDSAFYTSINSRIPEDGFMCRDVNTGEVVNTKSVKFRFPSPTHGDPEATIFNLKLDTGEVYSGIIGTGSIAPCYEVRTYIHYNTNGVFQLLPYALSSQSNYAYIVEGTGAIDFMNNTLSINYYTQRYDWYLKQVTGPKRHYLLTGPIKF